MPDICSQYRHPVSSSLGMQLSDATISAYRNTITIFCTE
jgi:hypothetical protein